MKRLIVFTTFFIAYSFFAIAQPKSVIDIFNKYSGKEGFTSITLDDPSSMISEIPAKGDKQGLKNLLEKTQGIRILTYHEKDKKSNLGREFVNDLKSMLPIEGFKEFLSVNEEGKLVKMLNKKGTKDDTNEFLMLVINEDESVLIWIQGNINTKDIEKIDKIFK